ncbi:MAG: hypothetical protein ABFR32_06900 [Bacteroidota bacterium]
MKNLILIVVILANSIVYSQVGLKGYYLGEKYIEDATNTIKLLGNVSAKQTTVGGIEGILYCDKTSDDKIYSITFSELLNPSIMFTPDNKDERIKMRKKEAKEWIEKIETHYEIHFNAIISDPSGTGGSFGEMNAIKNGVEYFCIINQTNFLFSITEINERKELVERNLKDDF